MLTAEMTSVVAMTGNEVAMAAVTAVGGVGSSAVGGVGSSAVGGVGSSALRGPLLFSCGGGCGGGTGPMKVVSLFEMLCSATAASWRKRACSWPRDPWCHTAPKAGSQSSGNG